MTMEKVRASIISLRSFVFNDCSFVSASAQKSGHEEYQYSLIRTRDERKQ